MSKLSPKMPYNTPNSPLRVFGATCLYCSRRQWSPLPSYFQEGCNVPWHYSG